jgi:hypothetical protein
MVTFSKVIFREIAIIMGSFLIYDVTTDNSVSVYIVKGDTIDLKVRTPWLLALEKTTIVTTPFKIYYVGGC